MKLLQEEITYLKEENKVKSEKVRMLSDKQNIFRLNTMDTAVSEKQIIGEDIIPTKPTKPLIVCLAWIYQIIRQTNLLKMGIH